MMKTIAALLLLALTFALPVASHAEHNGKIQILLLGDSTTEASIPRRLAPKEPQLEDVIRVLLAAEGDLPPANVINLGLSGEFIRRLLDSGRYDKTAAHLPGLDYIFIRYGLNDVARIKDFDAAFPKDFHELIARLRKDHPAAMLIPMTVIPMAADLKADAPRAKRINDIVRRVAAEEKLACFDIYPRYAAEQARGPNMLNYRRFPLAKICFARRVMPPVAASPRHCPLRQAGSPPKVPPTRHSDTPAPPTRQDPWALCRRVPRRSTC